MSDQGELRMVRIDMHDHLSLAEILYNTMRATDGAPHDAPDWSQLSETAKDRWRMLAMVAAACAVKRLHGNQTEDVKAGMASYILRDPATGIVANPELDKDTTQ